MNRTPWAAFILAILAMVAGCHSDKNPSKSDFAAVIQKSMQGRCGAVLPFHSPMGEEGNFPQSVDLDASDVSNLQADDDALVRAGLLHAQDVTSPHGKDYLHPGPVTTRTYTLTDLGKQQYSFVDRKNFFGGTFKQGVICVTTYKVVQVTNFTVPSPVNGVLSSQVYFTFSPDQVSQWAQTGPMQSRFPEIKKELAPEQSGNAQLVLTNNGWMSGADLK